MGAMEIKTTIKATILIALFSVFLEISPKNFINYLIFLLISYLLVILYLLWKRNYKFTITDSEIEVKNFLLYHTILTKNVSEAFVSQGYLQKKFNLESIYIISRGRNILIKDKPLGNRFHDELKKVLGERLSE